HREKSSPALLVDLPGVLVIGIDVGLIPLHHPTADVAAGRQLDAAKLNAAVGGADPELDLQLEIARLAAAPDEKRVLAERVLPGRLADDGAVLDAPEGRVAVPAAQRPAVEDLLESSVIVGRLRADRRLARRRLGSGRRGDHEDRDDDSHDL